VLLSRSSLVLNFHWHVHVQEATNCEEGAEI
jgi:hypothetical protein